MKPLALLLLLAFTGTGLAQQSKVPVKPPAKTPLRVPVQGQTISTRPNVSAIVTTNQVDDSPESSHVGFVLSGSPTGSPHMVDPYRVIDGHTNIVGAGWIIFSGTVTGGNADGIVLSGAYDTVPKSDGQYVGQFFIANYPDACYLNDTIGSATQWFYAWPAGLCLYTNTAGFVLTLRKFDYGLPWTPPPPTPAQLAARKKMKDDARDAILARALKANQDAAAQNDPVGLMRMGERYRDGEGVPRDLTQARDYLQRAAALGNDTAQLEFEAIKPKVKPPAPPAPPVDKSIPM